LSQPSAVQRFPPPWLMHLRGCGAQWKRDDQNHALANFAMRAKKK
jgi:hypothetical protein